MADPTVSASLDKTAYAPGETATLTVTYGDSDNSTATLTITVEDEGGHSVSTQLVLTKRDNVTVSVADSSGRTWTKVSDNGSVAVYTATV